ncbi:MAG: putative hydro-lyase [Spirochaetales bacterium]|nr:putative hydro-lyase [Spirochaetales bacterium]
MYKTGKDVRDDCRDSSWTAPTAGLGKGYVQANLAILPYDWAQDFLLFAQRNPKPCPILEVGEKGSPLTKIIADDADICRDLPRYRVYKNGELTEERTDISELWQDDFVYFLIGCSFTFEQALLAEDIDVRHITEGVNVPMYRTNLMCRDAGRFQNVPMVVSMRPFAPKDAIRAIEITRDYPSVHGSPVHLGDPSLIGIKDLASPDFGDPVTVGKDETPLFWACGVTPQSAAMVAKPPIMITHAPGHMFVGDLYDQHYKI